MPQVHRVRAQYDRTHLLVEGIQLIQFTRLQIVARYIELIRIHIISSLVDEFEAVVGLVSDVIDAVELSHIGQILPRLLQLGRGTLLHQKICGLGNDNHFIDCCY